MMSTGPLCRYAEDLIPFLKVVTLKEYENQLKLNHMVNLATSLLLLCKYFLFIVELLLINWVTFVEL